jgi:hypothetical protein
VNFSSLDFSAIDTLLCVSCGLTSGMVGGPLGFFNSEAIIRAIGVGNVDGEGNAAKLISQETAYFIKEVLDSFKD